MNKNATVCQVYSLILTLSVGWKVKIMLCTSSSKKKEHFYERLIKAQYTFLDQLYYLCTISEKTIQFETEITRKEKKSHKTNTLNETEYTVAHFDVIIAHPL